LEVLRHKKDGTQGSKTDNKCDEISEREYPDAKQLKRQQRLAHTCFDKEEHGQEDHRAREETKNQRSSPAKRRPLNDGNDQAGQPGNDQQLAWHIDMPRLWIARLGEARPGQDKRDESNRDIDEKDCGPTPELS